VNRPDARCTVALVAAVASNGVIGRGGQLPWHLPEDLAHFKQLTAGSPVIMGRRTWESLPARFKPLPGRTNIVVTRERAWSAPGALVASSLEQAIVLGCSKAAVGQRVFVIGGAELYAQALPIADELELTEIDAPFDGDTRFVSWDRTEFAVLRREHHRAAPPNDFDFDFVTYRRTR
jgi:dihydrofolate reductase